MVWSCGGGVDRVVCEREKREWVGVKDVVPLSPGVWRDRSQDLRGTTQTDGATPPPVCLLVGIYMGGLTCRGVVLNVQLNGRVHSDLHRTGNIHQSLL